MSTSVGTTTPHAPSRHSPVSLPAASRTNLPPGGSSTSSVTPASREHDAVDEHVVSRRVEQLQPMLARSGVELDECREVVLGVVEAEPGDRLPDGRDLGRTSDDGQERTRRVDLRIPEIERRERLTRGEEVVVRVDQPGEDRGATEISFDRARPPVTHVRTRPDPKDLGSPHSARLDPRRISRRREHRGTRVDDDVFRKCSFQVLSAQARVRCPRRLDRLAISEHPERPCLVALRGDSAGAPRAAYEIGGFPLIRCGSLSPIHRP